MSHDRITRFLKYVINFDFQLYLSLLILLDITFLLQSEMYIVYTDAYTDVFFNFCNVFLLTGVFTSDILRGIKAFSPLRNK